MNTNLDICYYKSMKARPQQDRTFGGTDNTKCICRLSPLEVLFSRPYHDSLACEVLHERTHPSYLHVWHVPFILMTCITV